VIKNRLVPFNKQPTGTEGSSMKNLLCLALMALALIWGSTASATCKSSTIIEELAEAESKGETAFADMDLDGLRAQAKKAREILACLSEPVNSKHAAAFHRLMALEAFTHQNDDRVIAEFHAARKLDPGYQFPEDVAGEDHPVRELYKRAATAEDGELQTVYPPKGGYATVGGVRGAPRPEKTPVIIQVFTKRGKIKGTHYIESGKSLGKLGKPPVKLVAKVIPPLPPEGWAKPNRWYYTAAASAALAGVLYAAALQQKSEFEDTSGTDTASSDKDLAGYKSRANGLGYASVALGSLGVIATGIGFTLQLNFSGDEKATKVSFTPSMGRGFANVR